MIQVGWSHCGLQQAFQQRFQNMAMDMNMKTPLFEVETQETERDFVEKEEDADTDHSIESVMEDSLTRVTEIVAANRNTSISTLKNIARKRFVPAHTR
jgi:hypothetical protein